MDINDLVAEGKLAFQDRQRAKEIAAEWLRHPSLVQAEHTKFTHPILQVVEKLRRAGFVVNSQFLTHHALSPHPICRVTVIGLEPDHDANVEFLIITTTVVPQVSNGVYSPQFSGEIRFAKSLHLPRPDSDQDDKLRFGLRNTDQRFPDIDANFIYNSICRNIKQGYLLPIHEPEPDSVSAKSHPLWFFRG